MTETGSELLPFEQIGGAPAVRSCVERFYDLMDQDPRFAELRGIHGDDLGPMRESLTGFLTGWLGGPRDWFAEHPGTCIMSAHRNFGFGKLEADQWLEAMAESLAYIGAPNDLADKLNSAFARMGRAMQAE